MRNTISQTNLGKFPFKMQHYKFWPQGLRWRACVRNGLRCGVWSGSRCGARSGARSCLRSGSRCGWRGLGGVELGRGGVVPVAAGAALAAAYGRQCGGTTPMTAAGFERDPPQTPPDQALA